MPARFTEVVPDVLYRGGAPTSVEIPMLKDKWGIKQIVSLDSKAGKAIAQDCARLGIKHVIFPVHEWTENGRGKMMEQIDVLGVSNIVAGIPTYVHCRHGKDRTGMFVGRFRTENGWDAKRAVEEAVTFGFGTGVDDKSVSHYLEVINHGPDAGKAVSLEEWRELKDQYDSVCPNCGMAIKEDVPCEKCEGSKSALHNLVDSARESSLYTFQNPGDTIGVSDLWNTEENVINMSNEQVSASKYNTQTRRGIVNALKKYVMAQQISGQEVSQEVGESDEKFTEDLIERLNAFIKLVDALVENQISRFIDLFKNTKGITYEMIEEIDAEPFFINLGKNLKKNIWRMIGNRYIDLNEDIDEDKLQKEHTESAQTKQNKEDTPQTIFDLCLDGLSKFNKDTHIGPMQKSLEEAVKGLADLVVDLAEYMENDLQNDEMQQHISATLESIQNQVATIKTLVKDRIIYTLNKDVLGKDKPYNDDKSDMSALKSVIHNER